MKKAKIYSMPSCPWCEKLKKYLDSKGVEYEGFNIESDEEARKECYRLSGDLAVPVITFDGENAIVGFDKAKIDAALAE